ncbi:MAG: outer membrane lipoprotein-sorting protein [Pseudomonadota bacterium]
MKPINLQRVFERITARPMIVVMIAIVLIGFLASGLSRLVKDTSVKAFIPPEHPSLIADQRAESLFGLSDTIAVAVLADDGETIFRPVMLQQVTELTEAIQSLDNIRYDRVISVATESSIRGDGQAVMIDPYVETLPLSAEDARGAALRWSEMAPHVDTLVSADRTGAVILAELVDTSAAAATYEAVMTLVTQYDKAGTTLHVAGPGAVSGYLSRYIDQDARKLQPLVLVAVLAFILAAFRRVRALTGPLVVVIGSAGGALGAMAWLGIPYYAITNALPVIIVAIAVADAIHILSEFFLRRERSPDKACRELVIESMSEMARPITLTTLTTVAGFSGIALASIMPPITWFAVFAGLGVVFAWVLSMLVLPNVLLLVDPGHSPAIARWHARREARPSMLTKFASKRAYAVGVICLVAALTMIAVDGAGRLKIDRSQVENFAPGEPIRVADALINEAFAGTTFLDVIVSGSESESLLSVEAMQQIRALQAYAETLPHVRKTVSVVDYLAALHGALESLFPRQISERTLPDSDALISETLFTYELNADPADLEEEIDPNYQHALVRIILDADRFSETRVVVEAVETYITDHLSGGLLTASLAGEANISYHWMTRLGDSHFQGVLLSLALVVAISSVMFRSLICGVIATIPVALTVVALYACMGWFGINLEPATSMFAAIALGVGIDFAIHLVDRLRAAAAASPLPIEKIMTEALPPVARACLFNSAALGLGFAVLLASDLPTLMRFGGLVALAALVSYLLALLVVPALFLLRRRWFDQHSAFPASGVTALMVLLGTGLFVGEVSANEHSPQSVAQKVADRAEHASSRREMIMTLVNRSGRSEQRSAVLHKRVDDDRHRTRITFESPRKFEGMAFLSDDPGSGGASNRWMYLPTSGRARRIPATRRGQAFFGTDFSYADIQSELKFDLQEWTFTDGELDETGRTYRLVGSAIDAKTARALGYAGFEADIDTQTWMPRRITFSDAKGKPLKTIDVTEISNVDGIPTATHIVATQHRKERRTDIEFRDIDTGMTLDERLFDANLVTRGLGHLEVVAVR